MVNSGSNCPHTLEGNKIKVLETRQKTVKRSLDQPSLPTEENGWAATINTNYVRNMSALFPNPVNIKTCVNIKSTSIPQLHGGDTTTRFEHKNSRQEAAICQPPANEPYGY